MIRLLLISFLALFLTKNTYATSDRNIIIPLSITTSADLLPIVNTVCDAISSDISEKKSIPIQSANSFTEEDGALGKDTLDDSIDNETAHEDASSCVTAVLFTPAISDDTVKEVSSRRYQTYLATIGEPPRN